MISQRKSQFLSNPHLFPYKIAALDLVKVRSHYSKLGIKIVINGETEFGRAEQERIKTKLQKLETELNDPALKYAAYIQQNWEPSFPFKEFPITHKFLLEKLLPVEKIAQLTGAFAEFLTPDCQLKPLSEEDLLALNQLSIIEIDKNFLDQEITNFLTFLQSAKNDVGLEQAECVAEMRYLQSTLTADAVLGYIHTNQHRETRGHFEVYIVTRENIIKPVCWPDCNRHIAETLLTPYTPWPSLSGSSEERVSVPFAQADNEGCGTLGLVYLKELLRDDARQLNELSLQIPCLKPDGESFFFFLPSPQVLRYSQSSRFNKMMAAMLEDDYVAKIEHQEGTLQFYTVKGLLHFSLMIAGMRNLTALKEPLQKLLADLPDFRARWLTAYYDVAAKRDLMSQDGRNYYLSYKTQYMEKIIDSHDVSSVRIKR